jgi:type IV pilus assembly protein PilE
VAAQDKIHRTVGGFSLVELMVVLGIVGILLGIAAPSYREYSIRANRAAAKTFLLEVASRQEQFATSNRAYAATLGELGLTVSAEVDSQYDVSTSPVTITVSIPSGTSVMQGFTATATPKPGSSQVSDGPLAINQFGLKTPIGKW